MNTLKSAFLVALLSVFTLCFALALACGDDDDDQAGEGCGCGVDSPQAVGMALICSLLSIGLVFVRRRRLGP